MNRWTLITILGLILFWIYYSTYFLSYTLIQLLIILLVQGFTGILFGAFIGEAIIEWLEMPPWVRKELKRNEKEYARKVLDLMIRTGELTISHKR